MTIVGAPLQPLPASLFELRRDRSVGMTFLGAPLQPPCELSPRGNCRRAAEVPFVALFELDSSLPSYRSGEQCDGWLLSGIAS